MVAVPAAASYTAVSSVHTPTTAVALDRATLVDGLVVSATGSTSSQQLQACSYSSWKPAVCTPSTDSASRKLAVLARSTQADTVKLVEVSTIGPAAWAYWLEVPARAREVAPTMRAGAPRVPPVRVAVFPCPVASTRLVPPASSSRHWATAGVGASTVKWYCPS